MLVPMDRGALLVLGEGMVGRVRPEQEAPKVRKVPPERKVHLVHPVALEPLVLPALLDRHHLAEGVPHVIHIVRPPPRKELIWSNYW